MQFAFTNLYAIFVDYNYLPKLRMVKTGLKYILMSLIWVAVGISALLFFAFDLVIWLLTFWWDKRLWILHRYSCVWAMFYIWVNPFWKIDFEGKEHVKPDQSYVIISNHQSMFDIVLLYKLWMHFKWVSKREVFRIPVIGWNLWLNKHIAINRAKPSDARKMIRDAEKYLNQKTSILIFPEGTRSTDGAIQRFKDGAFMLSKASGYPILPVIIDGSREVAPKNSLMIKGKQTFTMRILEPIIPQQDKSVGQWAKEVNEMYINVHKQIAPQYYQGSESNNNIIEKKPKEIFV